MLAGNNYFKCIDDCQYVHQMYPIIKEFSDALQDCKFAEQATGGEIL